VSHLRTHRDDHEIDLIVERDGGVLAIEVKLTLVPTERHVQHLRWLEDQFGDQILDSVIIEPFPSCPWPGRCPAGRRLPAAVTAGCPRP
jgi:hypothetical protein